MDLYQILIDAGVIEPGEKVEVMTPQFERADGRTPAHVPNTEKFFDWLKTQPPSVLVELGCGNWENNHWLYPGEWYESIPEGYEMLSISGKTKKFEKGKTDNDIRYGCLAYGFVSEVTEQ